MEVPKRIQVDFGSINHNKDSKKPPENGGRNHVPAGYYTDSEDDYDYSSGSFSPPRVKVETTATLMSPPGKLTIPEISDEERRRFVRDSSMSAADVAYLPDDSLYKTPNDTILRNMSNLQSGDPVSLSRQVRHLHNRLKLLEEELHTQHQRQVFLIGVLSSYIIYKSIRMICR